MNTHILRFGFASLSASCFLLALTGTAAASARRVPASICSPDTDYPGDYVFERGIANQSWGPLGRERWVHCGILDDDVFIAGVGTPGKKIATNGLWIDGWDGNVSADIKVQVCQYQPWTSGVSCSGWKSASYGVGAYSTNFAVGTSLINELTNVDHQYWYPDLMVSLPMIGDWGKSSFYGYVIY